MKNKNIITRPLPKLKGNDPEEIIANFYHDLKIEDTIPDDVIINSEDSLKLFNKMRRNNGININDEEIHKILLNKAPQTDTYTGIKVPRGTVKIKNQK